MSRTLRQVPPCPGGRSTRIIGLGLTVLLAATACGTRVDPARYQAALRAEAGIAAQSGAVDDSVPRQTASDPTTPSTTGPAPVATSTTPLDVATEAESGSGSSSDPPGDGNRQPVTTGGQGAPAAAPTAQATSEPASAPAANGDLQRLSDDVVGDTIVIGMHVPMTGAAPMPTDWTKYLDVIQQYINEELPIHGRKIQIMVEDDGYDPAQALAACRKLADSDPLFVIGHTMPAAEDACAGFFDSRNIPYLARGTTPDVLSGRPFTFFGTVPDDLQGRLLADYVVANLDGADTPIGVLYQNDQTAAKDHFVARLAELGVEVALLDEGVPRQNDYSATIQKLKAAGAGIVLISAPPVDAIKLSVQSSSQGYHPTWLGGGSYWNYNMVLESAGAALDGAVSFSPWPSIDSAAADDFKAVYARYRPSDEAEDIGLIIWGWLMLVRQALDDAGPDLSQRSFVEAVRQLTFAPPYWNPVSYPDHGARGTNSVAVFRADGQAKRWRQVSGFTTGF
jgi:branched-chain amino acid transport system substrate-binding protein